MEKINILLIEDDEAEAALIMNNFKKLGVTLDLSTNHKDAIRKISTKKYDAVLIDLYLNGDLVGDKLVSLARTNNIPNVYVSSNFDKDDPLAQKLFALGTTAFFSKHKLKKKDSKICASIIGQCKKIDFEDLFENRFVTQDVGLRHEIQILCHSFLGYKPLFISGPTGTGKTELAKILHELSGRLGKFVSLNCATFNESLLESELFGHKKGSFTGATENRSGKLLQAHNGTIFLDEIATMPLSIQAKLLKAIEEKEFYPAGSDEKVSSDFRVISATKEDLLLEVKKNKFRDDLYYRIAAFILKIKPLKERRDDIPLLIKYFPDQNATKTIIDPTAMAYLQNYDWSGNVRELKNFVESLDKPSLGLVTKKHLPEKMIHNIPEFDESMALLDERHLEFIYKIGLRKFIKKIAREAVHKIFELNHEKMLDTLEDLKISRTKYYDILEIKETAKGVFNERKK